MKARFSLATLVFLLLSVCDLHAQATATLVGTIHDASGAVIPGASIQVRNTDTGFTRDTKSNKAGDYNLSALPIGRYVVTTTASGFNVNKVEGVVLQVAQEGRVDVTLAPAGTVQNVTVTQSQSLIQTESSSVSQVIDNRMVLDLPLVTRNFVDLVALTPGALTSDNFYGPTSGEVEGYTTAAISGGQSSKTEFLFDGITDQEELFDGVQFTPSIDFTQEFRVQSNGFPAQYGRGSAVVNISSRAGGNHVHGTAFEFIRNNAVDAINYFATSAQVLRRNNFGGSVGGPILHDRLFYFLNYEGLRQNEPGTIISQLPTAAQRAGDFSSLLPGTVLIDRATGLPYPNNQIPVDPAIAYLLKYVPIPSANGTYTANTSNINNYDQGNVRVDYTLSQSDNIFGRLSIQDSTLANPGPYPQVGGKTRVNNYRNAAGGWTHVFSPRLVNELRVGYNRLYTAGGIEGTGTNYSVMAGLLGLDQTSQQYPGFPDLSVSGYGLFAGGAFATIINPTQTYNLIDTVNYNFGKHALTAGIDLRRFHFVSTNDAWGRGSYDWYGPNPLADFIAGYPDGGIRSFPRNIFGERTFDYPIFLQDDWKVSQRLVLNLGVRWDLAAAPSQDFGQNSNFDPNTGLWTVSTYHGAINLGIQGPAQSIYDTSSQYIQTAQQAHISNNLQTITHKNFAPRLGFAFRPFSSDNTVVRGAYGISYLLPRGNNTVTNAISNVPFVVNQFIFLYQPTPPITIENFFNNPLTGARTASENDLFIRSPYNQEWNLAVQQELVRNLSLQLGYVGNRGTRLERELPINYPDIVTGARKYDYVGSGAQWFNNSGDSYYHALQTTLEKRASTGATFLLSYTWAKLIDNAVEGSDDQDTPAVQNPYNLRQDRGRGQLDFRHRFVGSFILPLPYGRGQKFGANINRGLDLVAGGWRLGGIVQMQSGIPFGVSWSGNTVNSEYNGRPDQVKAHVTYPRSLTEWFDPSAFADPAPGTIGNAGRNTLDGPRYQNVDLSVLKEFHYSEHTYLELRVEAFNLLNHPNFAPPNGNIDQTGTFGVGTISSAADPRRLQGGAKLYF